MRFLIAGLALSAMSTAVAAEDLWREGCWRRVYSEAHLAAHPQQQVTEIAIRLTGDQGSDGRLGMMDIHARVRPIAGHDHYRRLRPGQSGTARLLCFETLPGEPDGAEPRIASCAHEKVCSLDEWVNVIELDGHHAMVEDGSYGPGSVMVPVGEVFIGGEADCSNGGECENLPFPVRYRMDRVADEFCAAVFRDVKPNDLCLPGPDQTGM